jgi:hypothetical protein
MEIEVSEADCVSLQQKRSNLAKGVYSKCYEPRTLLREEYRVLARQYSKTILRVPIRTQKFRIAPIDGLLRLGRGPASIHWISMLRLGNGADVRGMAQNADNGVVLMKCESREA